MWKFVPNKAKFDELEPESSWQLLHAKLLQPAPITKLKFGTSINLLCVNLESDAFILSEQKMSSDFRDGLAAVQLGPTIIQVVRLGISTHFIRVFIGCLPLRTHSIRKQ